MVKQTCFKEFFRYAVLSVLGMLGVSCYILADTFFVSKGLGINGLAALNLAIPVYSFIHGTGLMIGMGGATKFCILKSRRTDRKIDAVFTNTLYLSAAASLIFVLAGLFFSESIAAALGADAALLEMAQTYLKWLLLFAPAFVFDNAFLCFVRNDGEPRLAMIAMLAGSFGNIILDYLFIFPFSMGIFGAVFATGLSPMISMLVMLQHKIKKWNSFHFAKTALCWKTVKQTCSLGFPSLIAELSSGIVMITFNTLILRLEGNTGVAAYGVIANISLVVIAVFTGISQGIQPLVSRFYGAGDETHARRVLRYAVLTTLAVSVLVYLSAFFFAGPITAVFNSESDRNLQSIAENGLKLYFAAVAAVGFNTILAVYLTSVERAVPAHILSLLRGLVLIVPLAFLLADCFGMTGVWITFPISELITALIGMGIYFVMRKRFFSVSRQEE